MSSQYTRQWESMSNNRSPEMDEESQPQLDRPTGASLSRSRPPAISVPLPASLFGDSTVIRTRTPTRASTMHEDVELGVYLKPRSARLGSNPPTPSSNVFSRRGSNGSVSLKVAEEPGSIFLAESVQRTDIITFCSHVRLNPALEDAPITHIQARKSRRLPFLHEYLLVFFTAGGGQRFVIRIDRLGKVGSSSIGGFGARRGVAPGTAIQEIGIYHIQDTQSGIESDDAPWLARDGQWGSEPVATLVTQHPNTHVSHHLQTTTPNGLRRPKLGDVSRLLEGVLLEMPTYHLTTANCYLMTRSSLILLQRCYPHSFECRLGGTSSEVIDPSFLAEPVWAGLLRWYLPFAIFFILAYITLLVTAYCFLGTGAHCTSNCQGIRAANGIRFASHAIFDVPLPIGLAHAYMNSLEVSANTIVTNISARFLVAHSGGSGPVMQTAPFGVLFESSWSVLATWCTLGCVAAMVVFIVAALEYGALMVFISALILAVWFNFKFGDSGAGIGLLDDQDELFASPPSTEA